MFLLRESKDSPFLRCPNWGAKHIRTSTISGILGLVEVLKLHEGSK